MTTPSTLCLRLSLLTLDRSITAWSTYFAQQIALLPSQPVLPTVLHCYLDSLCYPPDCIATWAAYATHHIELLPGQPVLPTALHCYLASLCYPPHCIATWEA
ncbi:hypothetical protein TNIN_49941 [Trichonephila inaurata madagascariensis]|uniref:Uncharacterized protein n=1 Tax=Trichonephila inaurata madagascariensis TaxID=2747483 RepID=A0A8X6XX53_9ARAC|nr:hypothetical protein TNIN_49941 [Trichonephila inaurata madagascariensis]